MFQCFAEGLMDIGGWKLIESKERLALWQKGGEDFISEVILNLSTAIGSEMLRGYTVKKADKILLSDYMNNNKYTAIWKIIYKGYDSSGNIYLELVREKDDISTAEQNRIIKEIEKISSLTGDEKNIIEKRLDLYDYILSEFLEREGMDIVVDPSRTVIILSINCIPPLKIEVNRKNSVINVLLVDMK
jgi:hypothetical protein